MKRLVYLTVAFLAACSQPNYGENVGPAAIAEYVAVHNGIGVADVDIPPADLSAVEEGDSPAEGRP